MSSQHRFEINYRYQDEPHTRIVESDAGRLDAHLAALRLIALHHADAENSLLMPAAGASPEDILEQAEVLGISGIRVNKLPHAHKQQP
ncbi:hypothetical protein D3879_07715 [Pseudomonas cavernicola]|uniref:Uncharacterized protein n=1 Tax=Pseudomonas cavernicola TaxID=2320866 RepID=A0A418XPI8_9PSED|nr:hypothetical protein [Pseudomonas cavernicola]RJG14368.1 hypothetical protein D3879_07715 [Pseudomonas cavernicola]